MTHIRTISRKPALAVGDVPVSVLIAFIIDILTAIATLFGSKEAATS